MRRPNQRLELATNKLYAMMNDVSKYIQGKNRIAEALKESLTTKDEQLEKDVLLKQDQINEIETSSIPHIIIWIYF